jgi:hypothetical protein
MIGFKIFPTTTPLGLVTSYFPQSVKITILAKNYGKLKDVNV